MWLWLIDPRWWGVAALVACLGFGAGYLKGHADGTDNARIAQLEQAVHDRDLVVDELQARARAARKATQDANDRATAAHADAAANAAKIETLEAALATAAPDPDQPAACESGPGGPQPGQDGRPAPASPDGRAGPAPAPGARRSRPDIGRCLIGPDGLQYLDAIGAGGAQGAPTGRTR
ncbi:MAG: hypothetical protein U1E62_05510 [Alsobacter sp.]